MNFGNVAALSLCCVLLNSPRVSSRTWLINADGSGDAPTIQAGIDSSASGDTVLVTPGSYPGQINFKGKNVVVRSSAGPGQTTLDGTGLSGSGGRLVVFESGEKRAAILQGFTITAGQGGVLIVDSEPSILGNWILGNHSPENGGGIGCIGDIQIPPVWSPLIKANWISNNTARNLGGGLQFSNDMTPEVIDNYVVNNEAIDGDGGGIYYRDIPSSGTTIRGNTIESNKAGDHGGGVYVAHLNDPGILALEIAWNVISNNYAHGSAPITPNTGGGIWLSECDAWVHNNTIVQNTGDGSSNDLGGGIVMERVGSPIIEKNIIAFSQKGGGIWCDASATPIIQNNLAWQNSGGEGVGSCATWWQSNGNVVDDPHFCDMASGDFTVASNSEVMTHPAGPLGAFPNPGCAPVPVHRSTWGSLKARY